MNPINEGRRPGAFILSTGNGQLSFDNGVLAAGENLQAGAVLGQIDGEYVELAPGSSAGDEVAVAILYASVDASLGDTPCVVVSRIAEVNANELVWPAGITDEQKAAAIAELADHDIVVR